jgi:polyisoprenoid-binding protein YceI
VHYAIEPTMKPEGATVHYVIETKGSTFTVKAFATGLLSALGHNPTIAVPDFEGEIFLNSDAVEQSSLRMVIHSASLTVTGDVSGKDREEINGRMHEEVLESDSFPDVVYECSRGSASKTGEGQYWVALNGDLTLHGVTRSQPVSARVSVNGTTLRAAGEFSVRQSDYEIRPVSALGGAVRLKDELKLFFDISARKQE